MCWRLSFGFVFNCNFNLFQDQDKLLSGGNPPKATRVETQQEQQWKQIQALRQQQSQQQQAPAVGVVDPTAKDQGAGSQLPFQQGGATQGGFVQRSSDGSPLPLANTERLHHVMSPHVSQHSY